MKYKIIDKSAKNEFKTIATTGQHVHLVIEGKVNRIQKHNLITHCRNSSVIVFGDDARQYLTSGLKSDFPKVGMGSNHVWCSNENNERLAIIYVTDKAR